MTQIQPVDNYGKPVDNPARFAFGQVPSETLPDEVNGQDRAEGATPPLTCGYCCPSGERALPGQGSSATCPRCPPPYKGAACRAGTRAAPNPATLQPPYFVAEWLAAYVMHRAYFPDEETAQAHANKLVVSGHRWVIVYEGPGAAA